MSSGAERIGQNIRDAGRLEKQEAGRESQSNYGVNKAEAAASIVTRNAYAIGRKIAEQRSQIKSKVSSEPEEKNKPELEQDMNVEAIPAPESKQSEGRYYEDLEAKMPEHKPDRTIREKETSPFIEREIKAKAADSTVKEKEIISSAKADNKAVREKDNCDVKTGVNVRETGGNIEKSEGISPAVGQRKNQIKTLNKGFIKTKGAISRPDCFHSESFNSSEIRDRATFTDGSPGQEDIKISKTYAAAENIGVKNPANMARVVSVVNNLGNNAVRSVSLIKQKTTDRAALKVGSGIKTREVYGAAENPDSQAAAQFSLELGRKLAKKNLFAKKLNAAENDVKILKENIVLARSDPDRQQQQLTNEVSNKISNNVSNNISGRISNEIPTLYPAKTTGINKEKCAEQQPKAVNIKTREYVKNDNMALNSVRESSWGGQKLFGNAGCNDVKYKTVAGIKTNQQGDLAGVKEKTVAENKTVGVQKAKCAVTCRDVKNNAYSYFLPKKIKPRKPKQFLRRLTPKNGKEMLAAVMGLGSALAVVIIICLIGSLFASPFGIFFSGADTMSEAVAELNAEFSQWIGEIKAANDYDEVQITNAGSSALAANWPEVLAVYAVLTTMNDSNPYEAVTLDAAKKARLKEVFWAMNGITYEVRTEYREEIDAEVAVLYISVTEKDCWQMTDEYGFSNEQRQMLAELKKPEYQEMFMALSGSYQDIALSPEEIEALIASLPADLSEARRQIVITAYQLEGKVSYFWGGKSLVLGWDSRWGSPQEVWAAGSVTTGTVRPFGLDCSGFVDWVFYNASGGGFVMGRGGGAASQHSYCTPISWSEAKPGDLVFYPDDSHVGIVCGFDKYGNVQIIHCAAGYNNVVVTGKGGFIAVGRPDYFGD